MNRFLSISLSAYFTICFFSQQGFSQDSLVRLNEAQLKSGVEKKYFLSLVRNGDQESISPLFLVTRPDVTEETVASVNGRLRQTINELAPLASAKSKPEKKIKAIYEKVHSTYLRKYEMDVRFNDIFINGNYNCVTATALFAIIFDGLNIPYEIKEKPTHVYLLAYPNSNNILVETTSPLFGYITFDARFKDNFINTLKNQKLIGSSEFDSKTTEELFNEYYFQNENIDARKLVGIHYINDALFKKDKNEVTEAFQQLEKAHLLYPCPRSEYLLMNFGAEILSREKVKPADRAALISKLSRYKAQGITVDMVKGEFANLTRDVLLKDNDKVLYKECFRKIMEGINDPEMKGEIAYIYYYENGRILHNQGNYTASKPYFEKALSYQPNNVDLAGVFINAIGNSFRNERNAESMLDSLIVYKTKYPSLEQNNNFNSMLATAYVAHFGDCFQKNQIEAGTKSQLMFEEMWSSNKNLILNPSAIGNSYSNACSYYFKKGQKAKAKAILNKGLEIAPDSYELRIRQQMLN